MATRSALLSGAPPSGVTKIKSSVKFWSPGFDVVGQYGSFYGLPHGDHFLFGGGVGLVGDHLAGIFAGDGSAVAGSAETAALFRVLSAWWFPDRRAVARPADA